MTRWQGSFTLSSKGLYLDIPVTKFNILNNVDIPVGVARSSDGKQVFSDYTQWVNIKDLKNNRMKIANYANRTNYVEIDLNQVFKSGKSKTWVIDNLPYPKNDLTAELLK